ncbi:MAG: DUF1801 domain-containing protein [Bacteroidia bacterium]|nr:DUF1801 domain-containing protein [Bacteroidia bacterium]
MHIQDQINAYLASQQEPKRTDLLALHQRMLQLLPNAKLWFLDGTDESGKVVSNPNIGYGQFTIRYKDGTAKEFYQVGLSGNSKGISVYIMGLEDKQYLPQHFTTRIGKAKVTGYCIAFNALKDIDLPVLEEAIRYSIGQSSTG